MDLKVGRVDALGKLALSRDHDLVVSSRNRSRDLGIDVNIDLAADPGKGSDHGLAGGIDILVAAKLGSEDTDLGGQESSKLASSDIIQTEG